MRRARALALALVLAASLAACGGTGEGVSGPASPSASAPVPSSPGAPPRSATGVGRAAAERLQARAAPEDVVLVGAGDIASCEGAGDEATAALLDLLPGTVATFGDNAYDAGTPGEFADCYDPSWGRHRSRTRPALGNHDYGVPLAHGYFAYFGPQAGVPGVGWYSYDLGRWWHAVVLNSNCGLAGGCGPGSPQELWLRADLAANAGKHVVAYWHHPRFSSGYHGDDPSVTGLWQALYDFGADLILTGHDHDYERFAPMDPAGNRDPVRGIRQFVVGTGGRSHYPFVRPPLPTTEARDASTFGVLVLTLRPSSYDWEFLPAADGVFTDQGSTPVHRK